MGCNDVEFIDAVYSATSHVPYVEENHHLFEERDSERFVTAVVETVLLCVIVLVIAVLSV